MIGFIWDMVVNSAIIFAASYALTRGAAAKGFALDGSDNESGDDLGDDLDAVPTLDDSDPDKGSQKAKKKKKKKKRKTGNHVLDQWLYFGGGYYGTVAFLIFVKIELTQFFDFISDIDGMMTYFANFGIGDIVAFFIDQLMNVISAFIWPVSYLQRYDSIFHFIIMVVITYFAYQKGCQFARKGQ